ncbi:uncharacterized protein LOC111060408 isoform X2 [Nilaparvata lugens]|uniref:uncharacterized protein LOC111060408 isoform X2 n=1 Tax=Nilaparvata lugens TaxID=108931 RepID=UPI00193C9FAA|nr:uncharacterized protein LOC111060408 isoform X2 [Nilaparvata lugens]
MCDGISVTVTYQQVAANILCPCQTTPSTFTSLALRPSKGLQLEIAQAHSVASLSNSQSYVVRNASTLTLPPAYDILMTAASAPASGPAEAPPPTYEEAMFLIDDHKLKAIIVEQTEAAAAASNSSEEARTKESD